MMTEEEARRHWCPFARLSTGYGSPAAANRCEGNPRPEWQAATRCIASECMAWRSAEYVDADDRTQWQGFGYCGLAGESR